MFTSLSLSLSLSVLVCSVSVCLTLAVRSTDQLLFDVSFSKKDLQYRKQTCAAKDLQRLRHRNWLTCGGQLVYDQCWTSLIGKAWGSLHMKGGRGER